MEDMIWYAAMGVALLAGFAGLCYLNIQYARGLRRLEQEMTPEDRLRKTVFANAARKGWGSPF